MNAGALLRVTGLVQGVGFRPFVHRLATRHGLAGWVRNTAADVEIAVEGVAPAIDAFVGELSALAPPQARVEQVTRRPRHADGATGFVIRQNHVNSGRQPVPPDVAICRACLGELRDPANRRFRYPFITCTDCGPRYSVIERMPYDRMCTSMRAFPMCQECRQEYQRTADRRYHSQTNSCARCGPALWLAGRDGVVLAAGHEVCLREAGERLRGVQILAVRGVGGFHLAADATSEAAVRLLRDRKRREAKPFAVMVATVAEARTLVTLTAGAAAALASPERPVVVAPALPGRLAHGIAPGLRDVGVMLPPTGLHQLLLEAAGVPLVMTSGNVVDEPLAADNDEAVRRLGAIADAFLLHDREIVMRCDDSVMRASGERPAMVRRARGHAPLPLTLPIGAPRPVLAVGPHLKNTLALAFGPRAWLSQHIGDLEDVVALDHYTEVLERLGRLLDLVPEVVARDMHPGYLSTRIAEQQRAARIIAVQHHHAHVAAVMAEHGFTEPVLGLACDGTGYGDDGTVWGSELLLATLTGYRRVGHLVPAPLPGGDLAARRPWRAALGYLDGARAARAIARATAGVSAAEIEAARAQLAGRLNSPPASSLGRLFDAAAAIIGSRRTTDYEGQAAMELEALATRGGASRAPDIREAGERWLIDPVPLLLELAARADAGGSAGPLAAFFHDSIAAAFAEMTIRAAQAHRIRSVVLSGGSFQNGRLTTAIRRQLARRGLRVLQPIHLPPNDGAVAYGQAAVAAAILAGEGGR